MDREEAEQALSIIRKVISHTRDDLIAHNWGLVWMIHAFTNFAGYAAIGVFVERQALPLYWYFVPLLITAAVDFGTMFLFLKRDRGVRSFVEAELHAIWVTYIAFTTVAAVMLFLTDAPPPLFGPVLCTTTGICFALMGIVFYRRFIAIAALFAALIVVTALLPQVQWWLIGFAWWLGLFIPGFLMHREKLERVRTEKQARIG